MRSLSLGLSCVPFLVVLPVGPFSQGGLDQTRSSPQSAPTPEKTPDGLTGKDWESIHAAYEAGRHRALPVDGGYRARNPRQEWSTFFDGRGFLTTPDAGGWIWGLDLTRYGWAEHLHDVGRPQVVTTSCGRVSYSWDDHLTEWYQNDTRGLEHGYTVHARPDGAAGSLVLELAIRGQLKPVVSQDGLDVRFVDAQSEDRVTYVGLSAIDAEGKPLVAAWREFYGELRLVVDDSGASYPLFIDPIAQQAHLVADNVGGFDWFGRSVSISGDRVVVGARNEDGNGTPSEMDSGAAYVFVRNGASWDQEFYLKASNAGQGDNFGESVSISGDTIVVGAWAENSSSMTINAGLDDETAPNAGAAYVFVRNGSDWSQQTYLKPANTGSSDMFGASVSISGNRIVVGAPFEDGVNDSFPNSGAAYVFVRSGTTWGQEGYLKDQNISATNFGDEFGTATSISGDTVVVGAQYEGSPDSGAAYVFTRSGFAWSQEAFLKPLTVESGDRFGYSVSVSGDTTLVGEPFDDLDVNTLDSGAAYAFVRSGTTWSQEDYLEASDQAEGDRLGISVSVSGDTAVVGSEFNGAYVLTRNMATWSEVAHIPRPAGGEFGYSVSVSGFMAVIGAFLENAGATESGAAYVYDLAASELYCTAGTSASGCQASIFSLGHASATATSGFDLITTNVEGQKDGLYFFGTNGRQANPWGNGTSYQCVVPPVTRTDLEQGTGTTGMCDGQIAEDLNAMWCPSCPDPQKNPGAGAVVQAQLWYRDPLNTSNQTTSFSDAIEFPVIP